MSERSTLLCVARAFLWLTAFQLVFVPSQQQNLPGYLGCFGDDYSRALTVQEWPDELSVEYCFRFCLEPTEYKYAGLEYGSQCFCGSNENYDKHGKKAESDCQDRCSGNSDQICGDGWRLSIYRISQGVCNNDIGPPTNGDHTITNPPSVSYNLNNFKFFRTRVDFSCDPGYTLHGASSIECIETVYNNVTWSDSVPTCEAPTTTISTTIAPTTTHLESTISDALVTNGTLTTNRAPSSSDYITEIPGVNDPNTGGLQTGVIVGIAVGAAILIVLLVLVILLCRKRRKPKTKSPDVTMATVADGYTNNTYAMPEIVHQSTMPVYSQVIKSKPDSDDVYATPNDVTSPIDDGNALSDQPKGANASRDQESGWVENTLYACESFPVQPEAKINYSDGQTDSGSPPTMEEDSGWVENIIYE